jgi:hypothetical protein
MKWSRGSSPFPLFPSHFSVLTFPVPTVSAFSTVPFHHSHRVSSVVQIETEKDVERTTNERAKREVHTLWSLSSDSTRRVQVTTKNRTTFRLDTYNLNVSSFGFLFWIRMISELNFAGSVFDLWNLAELLIRFVPKHEISRIKACVVEVPLRLWGESLNIYEAIFELYLIHFCRVCFVVSELRRVGSVVSAADLQLVSLGAFLVFYFSNLFVNSLFITFSVIFAMHASQDDKIDLFSA